MVRHDDERLQVVVWQMLRAVADGIHDQLRDGLLFQVEGSNPGGVEVSVHPDKGSSRILFVRRRVERVWQAAVEIPGEEQTLALRPDVGKSTPLMVHDSLVVADGEESPGKEKKSRDESRLSRLDSLRHRLSEQYWAIAHPTVRLMRELQPILALPGLPHEAQLVRTPVVE